MHNFIFFIAARVFSYPLSKSGLWNDLFIYQLFVLSVALNVRANS